MFCEPATEFEILSPFDASRRENNRAICPEHNSNACYMSLFLVYKQVPKGILYFLFNFDIINSN